MAIPKRFRRGDAPVVRRPYGTHTDDGVPAYLALTQLERAQHSSPIAERRLAMAILETVYLDLQHPAKEKRWHAAWEWTHLETSTRRAAGRFLSLHWLADTLGIDAEWLRGELVRVAKH